MFNAGQKSWPEVYYRVLPVLRYMNSSTIKTYCEYCPFIYLIIIIPHTRYLLCRFQFYCSLGSFFQLSWSSFLCSRVNVTCSCSIERLLATFYIQSKSRNDSTPDTGSSKAKNTLGYERYDVTRYVTASSRLPTSLRTHPTYFQT